MNLGYLIQSYTITSLLFYTRYYIAKVTTDPQIHNLLNLMIAIMMIVMFISKPILAIISDLFKFKGWFFCNKQWSKLRTTSNSNFISLWINMDRIVCRWIVIPRDKPPTLSAFFITYCIFFHLFKTPSLKYILAFNI